MSLLDTLKSLLGLGGSSKKRERKSPGVTVERESADAADASNEAAVKGADVSEAEPESEPEPEPESEPEAEPEPDAVSEEGEDAEPASDEVTIPDAEEQVEEADESEDAESTEEADAVEDAEEAAEPDADVSEEPDDGTPVTEVKGIGPAYAERLENAGVHTAEQLAAADAAELAEKIDISEKRVGRWIDRARES